MYAGAYALARGALTLGDFCGLGLQHGPAGSGRVEHQPLDLGADAHLVRSAQCVADDLTGGVVAEAIATLDHRRPTMFCQYMMHYPNAVGRRSRRRTGVG